MKKSKNYFGPEISWEKEGHTFEDFRTKTVFIIEFHNAQQLKNFTAMKLITTPLHELVMLTKYLAIL